jgi:hypothetical protein
MCPSKIKQYTVAAAIFSESLEILKVIFPTAICQELLYDNLVRVILREPVGYCQVASIDWSPILGTIIISDGRYFTKVMRL